ncbi:MAG: hypothetical protein DME24_25185 [Verrucomicrobia bacterium]|nr:MAG: hypothetical protein DME24_25185 [Verrucomicrobiota bacterium]
MNPRANARRLRHEQTKEEKELWHALRAGRFAGFKFRRQHRVGKYYLDFYCPAAKLSVWSLLFPCQAARWCSI